MELTRIYREDADLEDISQDKVNIKMSMEEFITLKEMLYYATVFTEIDTEGKKKFKDLRNKFEEANDNHKIRWE